jgi:glucose-6-phosphate-specific signal transduction histidine kinase
MEDLPFPGAQTKPEPVLLDTVHHTKDYWREMQLMSALVVFFAILTVGVAVWIPSNQELYTTMATLFGGVAGSLLTKLRQ